MSYKPFVCRKSSNRIVNNRIGSHDLEYLEKIFVNEGYKDIFVVKRFGLNFVGKSDRVFIKEKKIIDGNSGDLYDRIKTFIGRPSRPVIHVFHLQLKE